MSTNSMFTAEYAFTFSHSYYYSYGYFPWKEFKKA